MSKKEEKDSLFCSFCGKSQKEVKKLIAGPTVFVCDECVELCMDIIKEDNKNNKSKLKTNTPKPSEINKFLNDFVIGQNKAKKNLSVADVQLGQPLCSTFVTVPLYSCLLGMSQLKVIFFLSFYQFFFSLSLGTHFCWSYFKFSF